MIILFILGQINTKLRLLNFVVISVNFVSQRTNGFLRHKCSD